MKPQDWQQVYAFLESMAELPAIEQRRYAEAATLDEEVRRRVLQLLDQYETGPDSSINQSAADSFRGSSRPEWPHTGKQVGRFQVTRPLGRGGMSEVYAALDAELDREVALKFLSFETSTDARTADRFVREARAASALNHPNIVTVHEVVHVPSSIAIVMEKVEGHAFRELCGGPNPAADVAGWGRQIADALAAAHAKGLIHRDLKPENLMLRPDGYVKVLDFGLARHYESTDEDSTSLTAGTFRYMSPEQTRVSPLTPASDIFSLGIVLYELATGVHPFAAETAFSTAHYIATQEPAAPSRVVDGLPSAIDSLVLRMLSKDAAARPSAAEVSKALVELPAALVGVRRRAVPKLAVPVIATIVAIAAAFFVWRESHSSTSPQIRPLKSGVTVARMPGRSSDPAFSPDGESLAFAFRTPEQTTRDIWAKRIEGGEAQRLTKNPADEFGARWSPDGRSLAFLRRMGGQLRIVLIPAEGGAEREIGWIHGDGPERPRMTWAPDGNSLIVSDSSHGGNDDLALYRMDIHTGKRSAFLSAEGGSDTAPTFSPDGKLLAFLRLRPNADPEICVAPAEGGSSRMVGPVPNRVLGFTWYEDSATILYGWGAKDLYQIGIAGGKATPAKYVLDYDPNDLTLSPRGGRMAFTLRFSDTNLWQLDTGNRVPPRKLTSAMQEDEDPAYAPDGRHFAFSSRRTGTQEIWISDADGSNQHALTSDKAFSGSAAWSPDGSQIAFDSKRSGVSEIWIVNAGGGQPRRLMARTWEAVIPAWSHDGKWIYFCSERTGQKEIWKARVDGSGEPAQVTREGGFEAKETQDGRFLYFSKSDAGSVWRRPLTGGADEVVPEVPPLLLYRYWDLWRAGLYFVDRNPAPMLRSLDFATGKVRDIGPPGKPPMTYLRGLAAAPDGKSVLYVQQDLKLQEVQVAFDIVR